MKECKTEKSDGDSDPGRKEGRLKLTKGRGEVLDDLRSSAADTTYTILYNKVIYNFSFHCMQFSRLKCKKRLCKNWKIPHLKGTKVRNFSVATGR